MKIYMVSLLHRATINIVNCTFLILRNVFLLAGLHRDTVYRGCCKRYITVAAFPVFSDRICFFVNFTATYNASDSEK